MKRYEVQVGFSDDSQIIITRHSPNGIDTEFVISGLGVKGKGARNNVMDELMALSQALRDKYYSMVDR